MEINTFNLFKTTQQLIKCGNSACFHRKNHCSQLNATAYSNQHYAQHPIVWIHSSYMGMTAVSGGWFFAISHSSFVSFPILLSVTKITIEFNAILIRIPLNLNPNSFEIQTKFIQTQIEFKIIPSKIFWKAFLILLKINHTPLGICTNPNSIQA